MNTQLHQKPPGRNDPCPCGSGKEYKKCCLGKLEIDKPRGVNAISLVSEAAEAFENGALSRARQLVDKVFEHSPDHRN